MPGGRKDSAAATVVVENDVIGDAPLNLNAVAKWGGVMVSIVVASVGVVWQLADIRSDIRTKDLKIADLERRIGEEDKACLDRHNQQQREIDRSVQRIDQGERNMSDLARKLDVAVAILERLDKKIGDK